MITKTALSKNQVQTFINDLLENLQGWINSPRAPSMAELEKFFAKNFQLTNNGVLLTRSLSDYMERVQNFRNKFSHYDITGPIEEPIISENQAVVIYELTLMPRQGKGKEQVMLMAVATIENNKLTKWTEVTHVKGEKAWDK